MRASDARVLLNGGQYVGLVRVDGTFVITDVRPGSHLLEVVNLNEWLFEPVRLDISARDKGKVRASPLNKPMERLAYPLVIRPLGNLIATRPVENRRRKKLRGNVRDCMMRHTYVCFLLFAQERAKYQTGSARNRKQSSNGRMQPTKP